MNAPLALTITGIGAWTRGAPDWPTLRGVLLGERGLTADAPERPAGAVLPTAERRRAPDGVRLAAEVAAQACTMAGADPAALPCIFASTYGELAITDYLCETLARAPRDVSPTRFHNSVLNAPAGYWTIATGCIAASSAVTAHHRSFAAGLLEAVVFGCAEEATVLFSACDVASHGPLADITRTSLAFGVALVLAPGAAAGTRLRVAPRGADADALPPPAMPLRDIAGDNPLDAHALALLGAVAGGRPTRLALPLSSGLALDMEVTP